MIALRRAHPVLRRGRYLADPGYVVWFTPTGRAMTDADWRSPGSKSLAIYVDGTVAPDLDAHGRPMLDDDLLILVNGSPQPVTFTIPEVGKPCSWQAEIDSFDLGADTANSHTASANDTAEASATPSMADEASVGAGGQLTVRPRSLVLLLA